MSTHLLNEEYGRSKPLFIRSISRITFVIEQIFYLKPSTKVGINHDLQTGLQLCQSLFMLIDENTNIIHQE